MIVRLGGKLPASIDRDLAYALNNIFLQIERAFADLGNRGLDTIGTVIIDTATTGVILKDTQGTPHYWRVTVDNTGSLDTTDLGTTKPSA